MCLITSAIVGIICIWIVFSAKDGQTYEGCSLLLVNLLKIIVLFIVVSSLCILFAPMPGGNNDPGRFATIRCTSRFLARLR